MLSLKELHCQLRPGASQEASARSWDSVTEASRSPVSRSPAQGLLYLQHRWSGHTILAGADDAHQQKRINIIVQCK